ncbi:MAG: MBL fold metallo-hydrolase, partial [Clostridia bacterium]|nr:MBL fold metallo-hydrolase [Clostridia bacterium]
FVGGFHYSKEDAETPEGRELLTKEAEALLKVNCKYYTCHCTGTAQFEYLKGLMGPRIEYISAGQRLDI